MIIRRAACGQKGASRHQSEGHYQLRREASITGPARGLLEWYGAQLQTDVRGFVKVRLRSGGSEQRRAGGVLADSQPGAQQHFHGDAGQHPAVIAGGTQQLGGSGVVEGLGQQLVSRARDGSPARARSRRSGRWLDRVHVDQRPSLSGASALGQQ